MTEYVCSNKNRSTVYFILFYVVCESDYNGIPQKGIPGWRCLSLMPTACTLHFLPFHLVVSLAPFSVNEITFAYTSIVRNRKISPIEPDGKSVRCKGYSYESCGLFSHIHPAEHLGKKTLTDTQDLKDYERNAHRRPRKNFRAKKISSTDQMRQESKPQESTYRSIHMDTLGRALAGYPFANSYLFSMILGWRRMVFYSFTCIGIGCKKETERMWHSKWFVRGAPRNTSRPTQCAAAISQNGQPSAKSMTERSSSAFVGRGAKREARQRQESVGYCNWKQVKPFANLSRSVFWPLRHSPKFGWLCLLYILDTYTLYTLILPFGIVFRTLGRTRYIN